MHEATRYILNGELIFAFRKGGRRAGVKPDLTFEPLLRRVVCPRCHGPLRRPEEDGELDCGTCRLTYPIEDGIPVLMTELAVRAAGARLGYVGF
jgi:uncharacterized protein YbaR (Trm112 family)